MTEPEGFTDRWSLFAAVPDIVEEKFEDGRTLTKTELTALNDTINEMKELADAVTLETTAIPDDIEDAMFDRNTERDWQLHLDALDNIASEWSKRGFTLPNTNLSAALSMEEIDYRNKRMDVSRDIMIKNWEITDANTKFAVKLIYDLKM